MQGFRGRHILRTSRIGAIVGALATGACSDSPPNTSAHHTAPNPSDDVRSLLASANQFPAAPTAGGFVVRPRHALEAAEPIPSTWTRPPRFQGAKLPARGNDAMLVRAIAGVSIPVRRLDARPVTARLEAGVVHYDRVQDNVDARVFATEHGVEDLWTVHAPVRELGYELDLPQGWSLRAASGLPLVEVRDASNAAQLRVWTKEAWDADGAPLQPRLEVDGDRILVRLPDSARWPVVVDPEWTGSDSMALAREEATLTQLPSGLVLVAGGDGPSTGVCELFDPVRGTFTLGGQLTNPRRGHSAIMLPGGTVLVVGGVDDGAPVRRTEVYDPATQSFTETNAPVVSPYGSAAVALSSGKVLLAGGWDGAATRTLQVYDPETNAFTKVGDMLEPRWRATATLLPNKQVLVTGGRRNQTDPLSTTEICDPVSGACVAGSTLQAPRDGHTATLLPSGQVMIAGGVQDASAPAVELINPKNAQVFAAPAAYPPRSQHDAVLLPDGAVMITGGRLANGDVPENAEIFDPVNRAWRQDARSVHERYLGATLLLFDGRVLTVGGVASPQSTELRSTASFADSRPLGLARSQHVAIPLEDGDVLLLGARDHRVADRFSAASGSFTYGGMLASNRYQLDAVQLNSGLVLAVGGADSSATTAELFDPNTGSSKSVHQLVVGRLLHRLTKLPSGRVLITGGSASTTQAELFDPTDGSTETSGYMSTRRFAHTATLMSDGRVLVAGGSTEPGNGATAEVFDPATGTFTPTGGMHVSHAHHHAALLPDGRVLIIGGSKTVEAYDPETGTFQIIGSLVGLREMSGMTLLASEQVLLTGGAAPPDADTAELFDLTTGESTQVGNLTQVRSGHTSTRLPSGQVLIAGGFTKNEAQGQNREPSGAAELYDPGNKTFSPLTSSETIRPGHTATLLPNGDVLLAGGQSSADVDLWDRKSGKAEPTTAMSTPREYHAATLLRSGRVLITGGNNQGAATVSGERYDWRQERFDPTADMLVARERHALTVLTSGKVLITGGSDDITVEAYDPKADAFAAVGQLQAARFSHAAVLLPSGDVLLAGGVDAKGQPVDTAELWSIERNESTLLPSSALRGGVTFGAMSAAGTALLTSEGGAWAFDTDGTVLAARAATMGRPISAIPRLFEGVLFCGTRFGDSGVAACATADAQNTPSLPALVMAGADPDSTTTRLTDGNLLVRATVEGFSMSLTYQWVPAEAVRPSIDQAPGVIEIGEQVDIQGRRFTSPSAVGSAALGPSPQLAPGVVFVPASEGAPMACPVTTWTDTRLSFEVPATPYHGRGWLQVMVAGVPSLGWYVELQPRQNAAACASDGECSSGFCVEGVCCDARCADGCASCVGSQNGVADGVCAPVTEGMDPREACEIEVCGSAGACDGQGACALVPERKPCDEGALCRNQSCTSTLGEVCASNRDCAGGQVCGARGACESFVPSAAPKDPGACSMTSAGAKSSFGGRGMLALLLLLGLGVRSVGRTNRAARGAS